MSTIRRTNGAVIWSKYDMGLRSAAASTFFAMSGWVRAAKDMIVPCEKSQKMTQEQQAKFQTNNLVKEKI